MEKIDQYSFYNLGRALRPLESLQGEVALGDLYFAVTPADSAMDSLLRGDPFSLGVSRPAAEALAGEIDALIKTHLTSKNAKGESVLAYPDPSAKPVPSWIFYSVKHALEVFETVFRAEMRETATYYVPSRGIYSTTALVDAADKSFPKAVLSYVPLKTREDWKAAGRCLAFSLLSASGFHVARAVEGTMEAYWRRFTGAAPDATLNSWHDYLKELDAIIAKKPIPSPAAKTITELKQMKDDYRNPIMHPRVVLNEQDARILFDNGESLIIAMADELREIAESEGGIQSSLAVVQGTAKP